MAAFKFGRWLDLIIDRVTHAMTFIDYEHHEVHAGNHYFIRDWTTIGIGIYDIVIETPAIPGPLMHSLIEYSSSKDCIVELFEYATVSADGTEVIPLNSRRFSPNLSGVLFRYEPTVSDDGDFMYAIPLGSGTNPSQARPGDASRGHELNLDADSKYLVRFTSGATDNDIDWNFNFYMHTDKEVQ